MRSIVALALPALLSCGTAARADPFAALRSAYAAKDPEAAAAAYVANAEVVYRYAGAPEETHRGGKAIAASFKALFDQIAPQDRLDLNFRETRRTGERVQGFYRLRIGAAQASYGRFDVMLDTSGRFLSDVSTDASREEFEDAAGPVMIAPDDETLDRGFYSRLTGRYRLSDGCILIVTRSVVRLFVRNSCTNEWRGLNRQAGRVWTGGDHVLSDRAIATYRFAAIAGTTSPSVEVIDRQGTKTAVRVPAYATEDVEFRSADGTVLSGTIYKSGGDAKRRPASVMLHGSGPQDRDGYASIIAVIADELAASGRVVLAFDKRGSGRSGGDGDRAGFPTLAADARAAMAYLATRPDVDPLRIGLAGSSQAGWVAAQAIADGAAPADVFLLGAAGAALTVAEQNLYNTEVRMRCQGIGKDDIALALAQQRAFFEFLADPSKAGKLDTLTIQGQLRPSLNDWLFPDSRTTDRSAGAWYVVLAPSFDPLPIWKRYHGRADFVFSQFDDSTPTALAETRLKGSSARITTISGAQHLGLAADGVCNGELANLSKFSAGLMPAIAAFGRR